MSAPSPSPAGNPPAEPARPRGNPARGCVPLLVFLLALVCAGSLVILSSGWAVRNTGYVVVEFLEQNSPGEMEAHRRMATTGSVLDAVIRRLNLDPGSKGDGRYELHDRILRNLQVDVENRFLTITVDEREKAPRELASALADVLEEDLRTVREEYERRITQNLEAQLKSLAGAAEKRRLEWMDMLKKFELEPAKIAAREAAAAELSQRIAKNQADLVMLEARLSLLREGDEARGQITAERDVLKTALAEYQKKLQAAAEEATSRAGSRTEYDAAGRQYQELQSLVEKLSAQLQELRVAQGVVKRPTRIVESARMVKAPDRRFRRNLELAATGSGILLAALLLASLTRFLRRG